MIEGLADRTATEFRKLASKIEAVEPVSEHMWSIQFVELSSDVITTDLISDIKNALKKPFHSIYTVKLIEGACPKEVLNAFDRAKAQNPRIALPRRNGGDSEYLYVGKSMDTGKRIADHIGFHSPKTYALHLRRWASGLSGAIEFRIYKYENSEWLQYLEDQLGEELLPLLGKRGAR